MRFTIFGFLIFLIFGIVIFSTQSFGNSLDTPSEVNKIGTFKISDFSTKTLMGLNLGTSDNISSISLTFKNAIAEDATVNISLKDNNDIEIGSGSKVVNPSSTSVTITLGNPITSGERSTLITASITVT